MKTVIARLDSWFGRYRAACLIFCAALGIRLLFYAAIRDTFLFNNPILDAKYYFDWAGAIARGDWFSSGQGVFRMSPGYSYFLALVFARTRGTLRTPCRRVGRPGTRSYRGRRAAHARVATPV